MVGGGGGGCKSEHQGQFISDDLANKDENLVVANRIVFNALKIFIKSLIRIFLSLRHDSMNHNLWQTD